MVTLLVTRFPASGSGRIEIIKENFKTEVCNQMQDYPLEVYVAAGTHWKDGKLSICGGYTGSDTNECYTLDNGEWKPTSQNLQIERYSHAASNIGNNIWITGGHDGHEGSQILSSSEIMHPDGKITPGPELPQGIYGHCQISHGQITLIIGKYIF